MLWRILRGVTGSRLLSPAETFVPEQDTLNFSPYWQNAEEPAILHAKIIKWLVTWLTRKLVDFSVRLRFILIANDLDSDLHLVILAEMLFRITTNRNYEQGSSNL